MKEEQARNQDELREERDFNVRQFLIRYGSYWPLFAISLVLAMAIAYTYNWYQNPVFAVSAKLHVRDDNTGKEGLLRALDADPSAKNIENEMEILRSYSLLAKTLNDLEFDVSYYLVGDLKVSEVYKDCPFKIQALQLHFSAYSIPIEVELIDAERFSLRYSHAKEEHSREGRYGDTLMEPIGQLMLERRDNFPEAALASGSLEKRNYKVRFNTMGYNQNKYLSRLSVGLSRPQSTILQLYLEDEVPLKALDFLNKLVEVYLENDIEEKNKAAATTQTFLDRQLSSITHDLEQIETNRERYKVSKGIIDLQSESKLVMESIKDVDVQRSLNNARIGMIDQLVTYVVDNADLRDLAPAALDISDPLLVRLINKLSELQSQREIILNKSTINDPTLVPLNAEIELTRSSLLENARNIRKGLKRKEAELDEEVRRLSGRMQQIPTTERELLEIERRFRIQEGLYTFLLQKRAELAISLAANESNARLVDSARLLPGPIYPIPKKAYSIAILLGFLFPLAFALAREKFNDSITDISQLKSLTRIPLIGVVRLSKREGSLVSLTAPQSPIAEEYRSIRTNLKFFIQPGPYEQGSSGRVLAVTSSVGTEGKTFNAMNLACVLAASGARVALVGLDLRKPRIVEDFGLSNDVGCSNFLIGSADLAEITFPSGVYDSLYVVPSGPVPPNPSELVASPRMEVLMQELRSKYDWVVIDTPPVGLVSDGLVLAEHADLNLFIVRHEITRREHVKHIDELHSRGRIANMAIIFNAVSRKKGAYAYASTYGYGAAYGKYFQDDESLGKGSKLRRWLAKK